MSRPALSVVGVGGSRPALRPEDAWVDWLAARLDSSWRRGEWDPAIWLFTGNLDNPRTRAWACLTPGCPLTTRRPDRRCDACRRAWHGRSELEDFRVSPERAAVRALVPPTCVVAGCESDFHSHGLCRRHVRVWERERRRGGLRLEDFIANAVGLSRLAACVVAGCERERHSRAGLLCRFHVHRWRRDGIGAHGKVDTWAVRQAPKIGAHQFSLAPLSPTARHELLYGLQARDATPVILDPQQIRILTDRLVGVDSLRRVDPVEVCEAGGLQYNADIRWVFHDLRRHVERAWMDYSGADPMAGDIWSVAMVGLGASASRPWTPATEATIDFGVVRLSWLRELVKIWARDNRPYLQVLRQALAAVRLASVVLEAAGSTDPARLGPGDFTRITDALAAHRRPDGSLYSAAHRNNMLYRFCEVIDYGRRNGAMAGVPEAFRPLRRRYRVFEEPNEEAAGRALPEVVVATLDAHLEALGRAGSRLTWMPPADVKAMHQTIYRLLRDTGRRPGEIVTLKVGCVEANHGVHNLVYDNHKAARMRRRLPITTETAQTVAAWEDRRRAHGGPPSSLRWLFPSPQTRAQRSAGHISTAAFGAAFRCWVSEIPSIEGELLGTDGAPASFDRSAIIPYALRHTYAQRHADAGVPVDVLRELMDHVAIQTTMGYYTVSLKRKAAAIAKVGSLALDASGRAAPFADATAYERASVSVPFGNCTEPSNVRAGGGQCPIRFQCAGCGFYRPDPSYLPALEEHIASLRADLETARALSAASYVEANLTAEIEAFAKVAARMRARLARLGIEERAEVEEASRLLRRARAARRIPVLSDEAG